MGMIELSITLHGAVHILPESQKMKIALERYVEEFNMQFPLDNYRVSTKLQETADTYIVIMKYLKYCFQSEDIIFPSPSVTGVLENFKNSCNGSQDMYTL